jgi:hypothetical protein
LKTAMKNLKGARWCDDMYRRRDGRGIRKRTGGFL